MSQTVQFLSGDLRDFLEGLSIAKRRAVLFALFNNMTSDAVTLMRWRDLKTMTLDPFSEALIGACRVNPNLDYVFWENITQDLAAPLFGLNEDVLESSGGFSFEDVRKLFSQMAWHDSEAELDAVNHALPH